MQQENTNKKKIHRHLNLYVTQVYKGVHVRSLTQGDPSSNDKDSTGLVQLKFEHFQYTKKLVIVRLALKQNLLKLFPEWNHPKY